MARDVECAWCAHEQSTARRIQILLGGSPSRPLALPDTASNDRDTGSLSSCRGPKHSVRSRDRETSVPYRVSRLRNREHPQPYKSVCTPRRHAATSHEPRATSHEPRATSHEPKAGTSSRPATQALGSQLSSSMYVSKFVLLRASRLAPRASRPGPKQWYQEPKMPQSSRHLPPPTSHDAHHSMPPRPASRLRRYRCATASQTQDARHETRDA